MNRILFKLILILLALNTFKAGAQKSITLQECFEKAALNHKLATEKERYSSIYNLSAEILKKAWLPSADAGASFIYNSDVVDLGGALASLPVPGLADAIAPIPHSQYRITVDINQLIYDGGTTREQARAAEASMRLSQQMTEVELYGLKEMIINYFYGIIILERQSELTAIFISTIDSHISAAESAVKSGVLTPADKDVLLAEKLKLKQQAAEYNIMAAALKRNLSDITETEISSDDRLVAESPETAPLDSDQPSLSRPELKLFDLTADQLTASEGMLDSRRRPKAYGFATLGYGNPPGNNFFRDSFEPFFVAGASLKWNIHDWNRTGKEKEIIALRREIAITRKSDAEEKILRLLDTKLAEIKAVEEAIDTGLELAEIRRRISASALSRFQNGTITASEYMVEVSAEREASITLEIKKITLQKAISEYNFIKGQLH